MRSIRRCGCPAWKRHPSPFTLTLALCPSLLTENVIVTSTPMPATLSAEAGNQRQRPSAVSPDPAALLSVPTRTALHSTAQHRKTAVRGQQQAPLQHIRTPAGSNSIRNSPSSQLSQCINHPVTVSQHWTPSRLYPQSFPGSPVVAQRSSSPLCWYCLLAPQSVVNWSSSSPSPVSRSLATQCCSHQLSSPSYSESRYWPPVCPHASLSSSLITRHPALVIASVIITGLHPSFTLADSQSPPSRFWQVQSVLFHSAGVPSSSQSSVRSV